MWKPVVRWTIALLGAGWLGGANAQEVRLSVSDHDIKGRESGANIQAQLVFGAPAAMDERRVTLRPYLHGSTNTDGNLTFGGGGVQAELAATENWFAEFQFGLVAHDGRTELPPPFEAVERRRVLETEITYGCDALFHLSPAIGRRLNDRMRVMVFWEHLSHGKILCDNGKNEGLDNIGVRVGFQF